MIDSRLPRLIADNMYVPVCACTCVYVHVFVYVEHACVYVHTYALAFLLGSGSENLSMKNQYTHAWNDWC